MPILEKLISDKKKYAVAVAVLLLFFLASRSVFITADPPPDLSISGALYSDEGFKSYAARNMALFGNWKWTDLDGYDAWLDKSPLSVWTYTWVFRAFGTGFAAIRGVSVVYSFLSAVFLFLFLGRTFNRGTALVGLALYTVNYFILMHGRLGFYETHIVFYLAAGLYLLSVAATTKSVPARVLSLMGFLSALLASWFIKRSVVIIVLAMLPFAVIWISGLAGRSKDFQRRLFSWLLVAAVAAYAVVAHLGFARAAFQEFMNTDFAGIALWRFFSFRAFSPAHTAFGMALYLEFIFLQPLTFFISVTYALHVFYRYFRKDGRLSADLALSSWLVFGFAILGIMRYNPSRYYLILVPPLIVLAARALMEAVPKLADFIRGKVPAAYRFFIIMIQVYFLLYLGVLTFVHLIPFSVRIGMIRSLYAQILGGMFASLLPYAAVVMVAELFIIAAVVAARKRIYAFMGGRTSGQALLAVIIALNLFQYGGWLIFHTSETAALSRRLGEKLPADSVLAGSWSAQLCIENGLRPLIMQDQSFYNHDVMKKLIANTPLQLIGPGGNNVPVARTNVPLYLAVCPDVSFERKIVREYSAYIRPENLVDGADLGYFNIKVYRIRK